MYVRVEYSARANGKTLEIASSTYTSKEVYKLDGSILITDIPQSNLVVELLEDQMQDLASAELYSKSNYEELGYLVEII